MAFNETLTKENQMKVNWKIVSALLAAGLTYDMIISRINSHRFQGLKDQLEAMKKTAEYLENKLHEQGVEPTEFDHIAINSFFE